MYESCRAEVTLRGTAYWSLHSSDPITWGIITLSAATKSSHDISDVANVLNLNKNQKSSAGWLTRRAFFSFGLIVFWKAACECTYWHCTCCLVCLYTKLCKICQILQRQEYLYNGWFPVSTQIIVRWCGFEPARRRCSGHQELEPLTELESLKGDGRNLRLVGLLTPRWFEWSGQLRAVVSPSCRWSQTAPTHRQRWRAHQSYDILQYAAGSGSGV